jgi:hypothetical protein
VLTHETPATVPGWMTGTFINKDIDAAVARASEPAGGENVGILGVELSGQDGRSHVYATDPEWLADRLVERIAAHATAAAERKHRERDEKAGAAAPDDPEKEARRQERQRQYEERVAARARNLDLGAALASRGSWRFRHA